MGVIIHFKLNGKTAENHFPKATVVAEPSAGRRVYVYNGTKELAAYQSDGVSRFEAWCMCPRCERVACHLIRQPNRNAPRIVDSFEIHTFGDPVPEQRVIYDRPDERGYNIIRMCECGKTWGQT